MLAPIVEYDFLQTWPLGQAATPPNFIVMSKSFIRMSAFVLIFLGAYAR